MDTLERRNLIRTQDNPMPASDYIVALRHEQPLWEGTDTRYLTVRYVPDRAIIAGGYWQTYLQHAADASDPAEMVATRIIADVTDAIVPRWCSVSIVDIRDGSMIHRATTVDSQPGWQDTQGLIALDSKLDQRP